MPVLNQVERRSAWGRTIVAAVYLLLIIGGVTMLFPFSVMFAGSISSGVDSHQQALFPAYLRDDDVLFVKFLEHKYGTKQPRNPLPHVNRSLGTDFLSIPSMLNHRGEQLPVLRLSSDARAGRAADWSAFLATVLYEHRIRAFDETLQVDFADYLDDLLDGDLDRLKHELKSEATAFEHVRLPFEDPYRRGWRSHCHGARIRQVPAGPRSGSMDDSCVVRRRVCSFSYRAIRNDHTDKRSAECEFSFDSRHHAAAKRAVRAVVFRVA